jgi:triosephosphate isomerase
MKYIIANWKAHKNEKEVLEWLRYIVAHQHEIPTDITVIIAAPYLYLPYVHEQLKGTSLLTSAQSVSSFDVGSYTGEVPASLITQYAQCSIIGHSERRSYFHESVEELEKKCKLALAAQIIPIYCVGDTQEKIPEGVTFVAWEPQDAIGNGNNEPVESVLEKRKMIQESVHFLYGGSVDEKNVHEYLIHPEIEGVLVGTACQDPEEFMRVIRAAGA